MGAVRAYVFPAIRILLWGLIALSLVWLAFFRGQSSTDDEVAQPTADVQPPVVAVGVGDIANTVSLAGQISAEPSAEVKVTQAGEISKLFVAVGDVVEAGAPVAEVRFEREQTAPPVEEDPENPTPPAAPSYRFATITTSAAGTIDKLSVLLKQEVAVGDVLGTVSPGVLSVSAGLTQTDQLRLLGAPTAATISVTGGPAPFPCLGLTIGVPTGAAAPDPVPPDPYAAPVDPGSTLTGAVAKCLVPPGTTVFVGMGASIDIEAGVATGVLVVPVTAVEGSVATGNVWVIGADDSEPVVTPVVLGLTDGVMVEIVEGLTEGDQILQFVPNSEPALDDPFAVGGEGYGG